MREVICMHLYSKAIEKMVEIRLRWFGQVERRLVDSIVRSKLD